MKSLNEHNVERYEQHRIIALSQEPHSNGIACPKCESELWDTNPMMTLTSNPPQKNVHCPDCGYIGFRVA